MQFKLRIIEFKRYVIREVPSKSKTFSIGNCFPYHLRHVLLHHIYNASSAVFE